MSDNPLAGKNVTNFDDNTLKSSSEFGNIQLQKAFNFALKEANYTLTITTKKGADLYAVKQRPQ